MSRNLSLPSLHNEDVAYAYVIAFALSRAIIRNGLVEGIKNDLTLHLQEVEANETITEDVRMTLKTEIQKFQRAISQADRYPLDAEEDLGTAPSPKHSLSHP